ncbi:hypothetical protein ACFOHU_08055 [Ottowia pentelensis]|uniref:Restriction system protein Mrr-like N-terminal domain-containing protein n=1 Tax=Ottowia pentelensis TaxID=511108 RepID=A0ABV6PTJ9_9BURK
MSGARLPKTAPAPQWLSAVNAIIVRAAARDGCVGIDGLLDLLSDTLGVQTSAHLLGRRLRWLRDCNWLVNTATATRVGVWRLTPAAQTWLADHGADLLPARLDGALPPRDRAAEQAAVRRRPVHAGPVTPPPRRNVLHGPAWQPPRWEPARAGADDHKQYATRGVRC